MAGTQQVPVTMGRGVQVASAKTASSNVVYDLVEGEVLT